MKQYTLFIALLLCSLLFALRSPQGIYAHVLEKSGTVGGVIHIDPDDDPIVGQTSTIIIELKDTSGQLSKDTCACTFQIRSEGKTLYEQPLFKGISEAEPQNIIIPYVFPRRDIYELQVKGAPTNGGTFQEFSLDYSIRVSRELSNKAPLRENVSFLSTHIPYIIGVGIILAFIIGALLRKRLSQ